MVELEEEWTRGLTLQGVWYALQEPYAGLRTLAHLTAAIEERGVRGGPLLSLLADGARRHAGDAGARTLYAALYAEARRPYARLLRQWVREGRIRDPYDEFFLSDPTAFASEPPRLTAALVPSCLTAVAREVQLAGWYVDILRRSGDGGGDAYPVGPAHPDDVPPDETLHEWVRQAYDTASHHLLAHLLRRERLMSRLRYLFEPLCPPSPSLPRCLKHYFLMEQADHVVQLLDVIGPEVAKPVNDILTLPTSSVSLHHRAQVAVSRLQPMWEVILRASSAGRDTSTAQWGLEDVQAATESGVAPWVLAGAKTEVGNTNLSFFNSIRGALAKPVRIRAKEHLLRDDLRCLLAPMQFWQQLGETMKGQTAHITKSADPSVPSSTNPLFDLGQSLTPPR